MADKIPALNEVPPHSRWFVKLVEWFVTDRNRRSTLKKQRVHIPVLERVIEHARKNCESARQLNLPYLLAINNLGLYIALLDRDMQVLKLDMVSTLDPWTLRFHARNLAILIHETAEDLPHMCATIRNYLASVAPKFSAEWDKATGRITPFKKIHEKDLKSIRDDIGAHRPQDALFFLERIDQIDPLKVMAAAGAFARIVEELLGLLTRILTETGTLPSMLDQMRNHPPANQTKQRRRKDGA